MEPPGSIRFIVIEGAASWPRCDLPDGLDNAGQEKHMFIRSDRLIVPPLVSAGYLISIDSGGMWAG
jgi:hypothetical protein